MKWIRLLFIMPLFFVFNTNAQTDTGTIKVFDTNSAAEKEVFGGQQRAVVKQVLMKFNPLLLMAGDFPVYFEKALDKNFCIELAPGITFRDYLSDLSDVSSTEDDLFNVELPYNATANSEAGIGYSFDINIKYFPTKFGMMNGIYLEPDIEYRHYVIEYPNIDSLGNDLGTYTNGHTNITDFKLIVGYEEDLLTNGLYWDFYMGLGAKLISGTQYTTVTTLVNNYYTGSYTVTSNVPQSFSFWRPGIYAGIKLGFAL
jgi:hypothetical protein